MANYKIMEGTRCLGYGPVKTLAIQRAKAFIHLNEVIEVVNSANGVVVWQHTKDKKSPEQEQQQR